MREVRVKGRRAGAHQKATVMLTGRTGTGKELIAANHGLAGGNTRFFWSMRQLFLSSAALHATLLECELSSDTKRRITGANQRRIGRFEAADKGTIFLDGKSARISAKTPTKLKYKLLGVFFKPN